MVDILTGTYSIFFGTFYFWQFVFLFRQFVFLFWHFSFFFEHLKILFQHLNNFKRQLQKYSVRVLLDTHYLMHEGQEHDKSSRFSKINKEKQIIIICVGLIWW